MTTDSTDRPDVKQWWARFPMTYGQNHGDLSWVTEEGIEERFDLGSREFFDTVDQNFYRWNSFLHEGDAKFGRIFPYARHRHGRVLEVGCGLGTMAMNWASQGAKVTAVDLNPGAVEQTSRRFNLFQVPGLVAQADGRVLPFANGSFDYVYSWGVLHHSPDLEQSLTELLRVLRPGGEYGVMLYHRQSIRYRYLIRYIEGFTAGESRFLEPLQLASRYTDGRDKEGNPHTWPVTAAEMRDIFGRNAGTVDVSCFGRDVDNHLKLLMPGVWRLVPLALRKAWARRWGWSLWISGTK
jgi:SAM-dependent methyltransferase